MRDKDSTVADIDDGNCTVGVWPPREHIVPPEIAAKTLKIENFPPDEKSKYILRLLMVWLWDMDDNQKDIVIKGLREALNIPDLKQGAII